MQEILANAWVQGGAILFLIVVLLLIIIGTFKYIVKPLWEDNLALREKNGLNTERVVKMGESYRVSNENTVRALTEVAQVVRDLREDFRSRRLP